MNTSHPLNTTFMQKIERMAMGEYYSNQLTSTQITKAGTDLDLDTNCENVWAKISYEGNKSLYLCTYYQPPSDKGESLEQLGISLNRVLCKKTNSNI